MKKGLVQNDWANPLLLILVAVCKRPCLFPTGDAYHSDALQVNVGCNHISYSISPYIPDSFLLQLGLWYPFAIGSIPSINS